MASAIAQVAAGWLELLVARWRSALKVRRGVRLVSSDTGCGPWTLGVFRPVIYLPTSVLEDPSSLELAVAHEMVHVARLDAMWLFLQHCLQAVYFFHPLVWVSGARLTEERERLADATVLAAGGLRSRDYALGLLRVARLQLATGATPSMSATSRRFRMRVLDIISTSTSLRPRVAVSLSITVAVCRRCMRTWAQWRWPTATRLFEGSCSRGSAPPASPPAPTSTSRCA